MSIDAYVMPLWRFKAGDVTTAVQRMFGGKASAVVTADGQTLPPGKPIDKLTERRCRLEVERLKRDLARARRGASFDWNDDGPTVYQEQVNGVPFLSTYALAMQYEDILGPVSMSESGSPFQHPAWGQVRASPRPLRFKHLIALNTSLGVLLPCEFEGPTVCEWRTHDGKAAQLFLDSAPALLREAKELREELGVPAGYRGEAHSFPQSVVCWSLYELNRMLALSAEHRLPVIFWG